MAEEVYTFTLDSIQKIGRLVKRLENQIQDLQHQVQSQPRQWHGNDHYLVRPLADIDPGESGRVAIGGIIADGTPDIIGGTETLFNHTSCVIRRGIWILAHKERGRGRFVPTEQGAEIKEVRICSTINCDETGDAIVCGSCSEGSGGSGGGSSGECEMPEDTDNEVITVCNKTCKKLLCNDRVIAYRICNPCSDCDGGGSGGSGADSPYAVYHVNRVLHVLAVAVTGFCPGDGEVEVESVEPLDCSCSDIDMTRYEYFDNTLGLCGKTGSYLLGTWDDGYGEDGGYMITQVKPEQVWALTASDNEEGSGSCVEQTISFRTRQLCVVACEEGPGGGGGGGSDDSTIDFTFSVHRVVSQYLRMSDDTSGSGGSGSSGTCVIECASDVKYLFGLSDAAAEICEEERDGSGGTGGSAGCADELPDGLEWTSLIEGEEIDGVLQEVYVEGNKLKGTATDIWVLCATDPYTVELEDLIDCADGSGSGS